MGKDWFAVDKAGLAMILARRGIEFALFELVSNALDTHAKEVAVKIESMHGRRGIASVTVTDDDPEGFEHLAHAFTLFAPSTKKSALEKRGRFNLGEKLVLAVCERAEITSTKGRISFDDDGRHDHPRFKREVGSVFSGVLRMTLDDVNRCVSALHSIIVPPYVKLTVNDKVIPPHVCVATFEASLATEVADADGNLKRGRAKATVRVYEPFAAETASIYELGIPVVATDDRWHVDVAQKVPLNMDRDNVPPSFLRELRTHVLNAMHDNIEKDDATSAWVREAVSDPDCSEVAVKRALDLRFGEKRVAYDPSDPEANKIAAAAGYTVVHGGSMSAGEWGSAREHGAILPAGQVTPSPKPFHPDGEPLKMLPFETWTAGVHLLVDYAKMIAEHLLDAHINVRVADDSEWGFSATYGKTDGLILNMGVLGRDFFDRGADEGVDRLLLHEFAHHFSTDHLAREFAEAGFQLGAKLKRLALDEPELFTRFGG